MCDLALKKAEWLRYLSSVSFRWMNCWALEDQFSSLVRCGVIGQPQPGNRDVTQTISFLP